MSYQHLTTLQRCQIETLKSIDMPQYLIAERIGVSASTVSRELKRNKGLFSYNGSIATVIAYYRRLKASEKPRKMTEALIRYIEEKIQERWSPEQISGVLKSNHLGISHERIYQHIRADRQRKGKLYRYLRHGGKKYRYCSAGAAGKGCIINRVDISERPVVVALKKRLGDFEGDTIVGAGHQSAVVTIVDKASKYLCLAKMQGRTAAQVPKLIAHCLQKVPHLMAKTFTFDNGKEFSHHEQLTNLTGAPCYFARPYCAWQRGLNEHTNGLIRQYFPKGTDFTQVTETELKFVEDALNNRPRKALQFRTPREVLMRKRRPQKIALHC